MKIDDQSLKNKNIIEKSNIIEKMNITRQHFSDTIPKPLSFVILGVPSVIVSSSKY